MKKITIAMMVIFGLGISAQAAIITLTNPTSNQQGEVRCETNFTAGATYDGIGDGTLVANLRVGETLLLAQDRAILARDVVKFGFSRADYAVDDLTSATLRLYVTANKLAASGAGSSVLLYYSRTDSASSANTASDFQDASFNLIGTMAGLDSTTATGAWYEFDVTAAVLDDLANDPLTAVAGSSFRIQLFDDLSITPGADISMTFTGNNTASEFQPQLVLDVIPEPATMGLLATFGCAILFIRRRLLR